MNQITEDRATLCRLSLAVAAMSVGAICLVIIAIVIGS